MKESNMALDGLTTATTGTTRLARLCRGLRATLLGAAVLGGCGLGESPLSDGENGLNQLVYAIDVSFWSEDVTGSDMSCLYDWGVRHVVPGTSTGFNGNFARQQLQSAVDAGMTVDAYAWLNWDADMATTVQWSLDLVAGFPIQTLWLDVEQGIGNYTQSQIRNKIQQAVDACGNTPCGIYTSYSKWHALTGNTSMFSDLPLWYAHYDELDNFGDWSWLSFGAWSQPAGKQYSESNICGVPIDRNIMFVGPLPPVIPPPVDPPPDGPPAAPAGLSPDGDRGYANAAQVAMLCDNVASTTGYEFAIQYDNGGSFANYYTYTAADCSRSFWPSINDTAYRYRIRAKNSNGWGSYSGWATFHLGNGGPPPDSPPAPPTGLVPDGDQLFANGSSVTMACNTVSNPVAVEFAIEYLSTGVWTTYFTYSAPTASKTFWPANNDGSYRFRARVQTSAGWSNWSYWASFVLGNAQPPPPSGDPPPTPGNLAPNNGVVITTASVDLSCGSATGATEYEWEINYWNGASWTYYYTYATTAATRRFWPTVSTDYRWRVRASNSDGTSLWSNWATFHFN